MMDKGISLGLEGHRSNQIETAAKPQLIAVIGSVDENDDPASMWV